MPRRLFLPVWTSFKKPVVWSSEKRFFTSNLLVLGIGLQMLVLLNDGGTSLKECSKPCLYIECRSLQNRNGTKLTKWGGGEGRGQPSGVLETKQGRCSV